MLISRKKNNNININRQHGASMIEYILGLSILVIALFVIPVASDCTPDMGRKCGKGLSVVALLEKALKHEYAKYSESIASPR